MKAWRSLVMSDENAALKGRVGMLLIVVTKAIGYKSMALVVTTLPRLQNMRLADALVEIFMTNVNFLSS